MGIEVSDEAIDVLRRSLEMGRVDVASGGGVRLRGAHGLGGGMDIQVELAEGPSSGEQVIEAKGIRIFVDPSVTETLPEAIVTVEPQHETIVVRPSTKEPDE
jgi:Fe-S cluster assembly iron-binding protein IscA